MIGTKNHSDFLKSFLLQNPTCLEELKYFIVEYYCIPSHQLREQNYSFKQQCFLTSVYCLLLLRYPVHYLLGRKYFFESEFKLRPGVLIPRFETEILVEAALKIMAKQPVKRLADIGCGSGNIILSIAKRHPEKKYIAVDKNPRACRLTAVNKKSLGIQADIEIMRMNAMKWKNYGLAPVDLVVCNGPYVGTGEKHLMSLSTKIYEPATALYAGKKGLNFYDALKKQLDYILNPGGWLILEIGFAQAKDILERFSFLDEKSIIKDLNGKDRVFIGQRGR